MAPALVSVIVPTLEEEDEIDAVLDHLAGQPGPLEAIVVDGGSRDRTVELARRHRLGPTVVRGPRGRAHQMNLGARLARGDPLVFLHADTRLPADGLDRIRAAADAGAWGGNFELRWDDGSVFSRLLARIARVERRLGVFYGDGVIWLRRDAFRRLGGYPPIPIMEDYALARMLVRSGHATLLPGPAVSSARRWRTDGIPLTMARWVLIRWAYVLGVSPARLAPLYPPTRGRPPTVQ